MFPDCTLRHFSYGLQDIETAQGFFLGLPVFCNVGLAKFGRIDRATFDDHLTVVAR